MKTVSFPRPKGSPERDGPKSRYWAALFSVLVFSFFVNLLMLTGPLFMLQVYDRVLSSRSHETLTALFLLVAGLYFCMALLDFSRGKVMARLGNRLRRKLDAPTFTAAMTQAHQSLNGAMNASVLREVDAIQVFLSSPVFLAILDLPWTPLFLVAIFMFHPDLGWLAMAGGTVLVVMALANRFLTSRKFSKGQAAGEQAHRFEERAYANRQFIVAQGMLGHVTKRLLKQRDLALFDMTPATDRMGGMSAIGKSLRLFLQSAMLAMGALLVLRGELSAGAMIAASILLGRALAPIEQILGNLPVLQRAFQGRRVLVSLMKPKKDQVQTAGLMRPEARVSVQGVSVLEPGSNRVILRNLSFDLAPGQVLGVIGNSGAGKSALAQTLLGILPIAAGQIQIGGAALSQYDGEARGRIIGYLPQSVVLFPGTIAENIARMDPNVDMRAVQRAAVLANSDSMIKDLPQGYGTVLCGQGAAISGGQRQMVALARALYGNPQIIVLDEPNTALDHVATMALNTCIQGLKTAGKAVVIMTHNSTVLSKCDQLLMLENGRLKTIGPRQGILNEIAFSAQNINMFNKKPVAV